MGFLLKQIARKAAEKAAQIDASDVMNQMNVDDIIAILKGLL